MAAWLAQPRGSWWQLGGRGFEQQPTPTLPLAIQGANACSLRAARMTACIPLYRAVPGLRKAWLRELGQALAFLRPAAAPRPIAHLSRLF